MARLSEKAIEKIIEKRNRASEPDRSASWRMSSLVQSFHEPTKHRGEVLRYFPIAVVAVLDGYFRARLASIIDSGEPFLSNAISKYPEIKLNLQIAEAIAAQEISLGELILDSVSIGNFSTLVQVLENITGRQNCLVEIAGQCPRSIGSERRKPFISNAHDTWSRLGKAFEMRHILCHELAGDLQIDESETRLLLLAAQDFIKASGAWIETLESPVLKKRLEGRLKSEAEHNRQIEESLQAALRQTKFHLSRSASSDSKKVRKIISGAQANLNSYVASIESLQRLAAGPLERQRGQKIDSLRKAHLMEPLAEVLASLAFVLELQVKYEQLAQQKP